MSALPVIGDAGLSLQRVRYTCKGGPGRWTLPGKDVSMNPVAALALSLLMIVGHSGAANASSERIDVPIYKMASADITT